MLAVKDAKLGAPLINGDSDHAQIAVSYSFIGLSTVLRHHRHGHRCSSLALLQAYCTVDAL